MHPKRSLYIAYVTTLEPQNIHAWSGLVYHIKRALSGAGAEVESVSNLKKKGVLLWAAKKLYYKLRSQKDYHYDREPRLQKGYASQIKRRLRPDHDLIFSPGTLAVGQLKAERPTVIWTDATFANLVEDYPEYQNLSDETLRNGHEIERQFLQQATLAIYSSDWAAQSAINYYGADPAKVKVVPFGANLPSERSESEVLSNAKNKPGNVCRLLFIGVDWVRKGGEAAVAVAEALQERGLTVELNIVGPTDVRELPPFAIKHGFLSKAHPDEYKKLDELMSDCHFLILPSRSECFGVVFAEAASYGLPSLASNVGGVSSAIEPGASGFLFDLEATPAAYCEVIEKHFKDRDQYLALARSAHAVYRDKLNWQVAGRTALSYIEEALPEK